LHATVTTGSGLTSDLIHFTTSLLITAGAAGADAAGGAASGNSAGQHPLRVVRSLLECGRPGARPVASGGSAARPPLAFGRARAAVLRRSRKRDRLLLIPPEQILWFQVENGIVKAHTADDTFWVNSQLAELEAGLPAGLFFRARREVLVNVARIREIRPYFKSGFLLFMADAAATEIVVSERQARLFRQRIPGL
jgi:hypothetical protein